MIMVRVHTIEYVNMISAELKGECHENFDFRFFPLSTFIRLLIMCGKKEWCALWYPLIILGSVDGLMGQSHETVFRKKVSKYWQKTNKNYENHNRTFKKSFFDL